ncbi:uncharacterized protein LOC122021062 [Zingiber officinale]|uniref:uncharacterized protein LOC122021062 n=1 Tax=Zingiber officinale TaxID=94328 RepID=UPI001C4ACBD1|nr:uncharacterized protein LOC122021062 [Zingiber officinale]
MCKRLAQTAAEEQLLPIYIWWLDAAEHGKWSWRKKGTGWRRRWGRVNRLLPQCFKGDSMYHDLVKILLHLAQNLARRHIIKAIMKEKRYQKYYKDAWCTCPRTSLLALVWAIKDKFHAYNKGMTVHEDFMEMAHLMIKSIWIIYVVNKAPIWQHEDTARRYLDIHISFYSCLLC